MSTLTLTKSQEAALDFQRTLASAMKTVNVQISEADLAALKGANYKLCFAKKIGDNTFNVVWQSYDQYLSTNMFQWTPQYQLFGSNSFNSGVQVRVSTNVQEIGLGQTSTLNSAGILESPVTGGPETSFTMNNEYGSIHPGVNQLSIGITGEKISTPIYVAEDPIVMGTDQLTPVEKVLVWFEQNVETSTMFSNSKSKSIELDLTNTNEINCRYENQKWVIV